jgi:hypothetical protein
MHRSTIVFCALLLISLAPAAAPNIAFAGRNCGGTSLLVGATPEAWPTATNGIGWVLGSSVDVVPSTLNQVRPSIAVSPSGQVFYAWQETTNRDSGDIFVGSPVASLASERRAVRIDDTGNQAVDQISPALAVGPDGTLHAVWQDQRDTGTNAHLYYASSSDGGLTWSANSKITTSTSYSHGEPALVAAPDGLLHLVWRGSTSRGSKIFYSVRSNGTWGAAVPVDTGSAATQRGLPRLVLDGQNGLRAAWEDSREGGTTIYSARLPLPGSTWGADSRIPAAGVVASRASLAAAKTGALYLAYQGDMGVFVMRSDDNGTGWSAPQRVDDGQGTKFTDPQIVVDAMGGVHCIWCQLQPGVVASIVAGRSVDGGVNWNDRTVLAATSGNANPLSIAADGNGNVYALWSDDRDNPLRLYLYSAVWQPLRIMTPLIRN